MFSVLVPKLKENDPNPGVTIAVLTAIGDLAQVSETEMRLWSPELLPILLDMLTDASLPAKREVALWTLAQLIESTGYFENLLCCYHSLSLTELFLLSDA